MITVLVLFFSPVKELTPIFLGRQPPTAAFLFKSLSYLFSLVEGIEPSEAAEVFLGDNCVTIADGRKHGDIRAGAREVSKEVGRHVSSGTVGEVKAYRVLEGTVALDGRIRCDMHVITGDEDTDFLGTDPANATSVNKPGFRSNDEAKATYKHNKTDEEMVYPHPVIQVALKADIVKTDETGAALEGAVFNLYNDKYDPSKSIEENAGNLIEANLESKKPTNSTEEDPDAVIRSGKLSEGTYYLVETETPGGYNTLPGPVMITVTAENNGSFSLAAEINGVPIPADKIIEDQNIKGLWKLSVQNTSGYELPASGGPGTWIYRIIGMLLVVSAGGWLFFRRRRMV